MICLACGWSGLESEAVQCPIYYPDGSPYPFKVCPKCRGIHSTLLDIKTINNETDYREALRRIETLMDKDPHPSTTEGHELRLLAELVERYEDKHFPMDIAEPV